MSRLFQRYNEVYQGRDFLEIQIRGATTWLTWLRNRTTLWRNGRNWSFVQYTTDHRDLESRVRSKQPRSCHNNQETAAVGGGSRPPGSSIHLYEHLNVLSKMPRRQRSGSASASNLSKDEVDDPRPQCLLLTSWNTHFTLADRSHPNQQKTLTTDCLSRYIRQVYDDR